MCYLSCHTLQVKFLSHFLLPIEGLFVRGFVEEAGVSRVPVNTNLLHSTQVVATTGPDVAMGFYIYMC